MINSQMYSEKKNNLMRNKNRIDVGHKAKSSLRQ